MQKESCCSEIEHGQNLQAMDEDNRSLELLPLEIQLIVLGKLGWTELATLACVSKQFLGLVRHCTYLLGLSLANPRPSPTKVLPILAHHPPTLS